MPTRMNWAIFLQIRLIGKCMGSSKDLMKKRGVILASIFICCNGKYLIGGFGPNDCEFPEFLQVVH